MLEWRLCHVHTQPALRTGPASFCGVCLWSRSHASAQSDPRVPEALLSLGHLLDAPWAPGTWGRTRLSLPSRTGPALLSAAERVGQGQRESWRVALYWARCAGVLQPRGTQPSRTPRFCSSGTTVLACPWVPRAVTQGSWEPQPHPHRELVATPGPESALRQPFSRDGRPGPQPLTQRHGAACEVDFQHVDRLGRCVPGALATNHVTDTPGRPSESHSVS